MSFAKRPINFLRTFSPPRSLQTKWIKWIISSISLFYRMNSLKKSATFSSLCLECSPIP